MWDNMRMFIPAAPLAAPTLSVVSVPAAIALPLSYGPPLTLPPAPHTASVSSCLLATFPTSERPIVLNRMHVGWRRPTVAVRTCLAVVSPGARRSRIRRIIPARQFNSEPTAIATVVATATATADTNIVNTNVVIAAATTAFNVDAVVASSTACATGGGAVCCSEGRHRTVRARGGSPQFPAPATAASHACRLPARPPPRSN